MGLPIRYRENTMASIPEIALKAGEQLHGFRVKSVSPADEVRAVAYELEHLKSGARLLHLHSEDAENLFAVSFPTPPPDDTGMPHILEHTVLAGSRRFPVRDPFFEMVKMSMATFINAMTGPDCTYYPVCSNVKQDIFNLAEVYFDAVFHPLLTAETFKREGHHLAPAREDQPAGELTVNGIVYNEMKAVFSQPEHRLRRIAMQGLFPDTLYGRAWGGDPDAIPDLTHEALKSFHSTFYHPSNAYFLLYGNTPTREWLAFLEDRLAPFERQEVCRQLTRQPRWAKPRELVDTYPIGAEEPAEEKTYCVLCWLVGDATDAADFTCLHLLSLILFGNEAAPLKKAIVGSRLGQDLLACGCAPVGIESAFQVGLKGSEPERADAFRTLVMDTLAEIADGEVARDLVEAAFQQAGYYYREIQRMYPLHVLQRVKAAWIYGIDPLLFLRGGEHLEAVRRRYADEPQLFNQLIRQRLVENPHRLFVALRPDREWQARTDAAFAERMKARRATLSDAAVQRLSEEAKELQRKAGVPNSPEALASLPQLRRQDLPPKPEHIPTSVERVGRGVTMLQNEVFSNGVNYLHLEFSLEGLPAELWPYVPRYQEAIAKLGAAGMDYEEIARRKSACTGGIGCYPRIRTRTEGPDRPAWGLFFAMKALDEQMGAALDVLHDLLFAVDPRDGRRMEEVLAQSLAGYRTSLVRGGPGTGMCHAARGLSPEGYLGHLINGLPQLGLVEGLTEQYAERGAGLMDNIEAIREFLPACNRLTASFTGSDAACEAVRKALADWSGRMRDEQIRPVPTGFAAGEAVTREGLAAPMQVAHCAQIIPAPHTSHADAALLTLSAALLGVDYMVAEIRLKGNAYGAFCGYDDLGCAITLGSYADPHVTRTLQVFADLPGYVRKARWTRAQLDRAIITTAKDEFIPIRPEFATGRALELYATGRSPEFREERYEQLLSATPAEVTRALLDVLEANMVRAPICVVSSREKLEAANREMPDQPLAIQDILS